MNIKIQKGCDIYPAGSFQTVHKRESDGALQVEGRVDFIPPGWVKDVMEAFPPANELKTCKSCKNPFHKEHIFVGNDCERCYDRKNVPLKESKFR